MDKSRNAEATKNRILKSGEALFSEKGFSGTSIRDIAERSGASGSLILFHFQDKKGIYEAVKSAIVKRYVSRHRKNIPSNCSFSLFLEQWITSMFVFYRDNPTMIRLANWARLEGDDDPWSGEDEWHHTSLGHIRSGQKKGEVRDDLDPLNLAIMICGAIHIWWEYHAHFLKHLKAENDSTKADELYLQQCLDFVKGGLTLSPENTIKQ